VIVMNNVFEWFSPNLQFQGSLWQFAIRHIKPGTLLVTTPDLATSLEKINVSSFRNVTFSMPLKKPFFSLKASTNEILSKWVRELNPTFPERVSPSELEEASENIKLYQVLPNNLFK